MVGSLSSSLYNNLYQASLRDANLTNASTSFRSSFFDYDYFKGLEGEGLDGYLNNPANPLASFAGADLSGANFTNAILITGNFDGAKTEGTIFDLALRQSSA